MSQYTIHNTTRSIETRLLRVEAPTNPGTVIFLGAGTVRVLRGRPVTVEESVLRRLHAELLQEEGAGRLKVTNLKGERVDLRSLQPVERVTVEPPLPAPRLDSAADDANANIGERRPQFRGNIPQSATVEVPKTLQMGLPDEPEPGPVDGPPAIAPAALPLDEQPTVVEGSKKKKWR